MPRAICNGIEIEYETAGKPSDPPLLLIMGLGAQLVRWPQPFVEALAAKGFYVIRFDNRDVGLSTSLDAAPVPSMMEVYGQKLRGERPEVPYTLDDMVADTLGLLDALGLPAVHAVGASLGAVIAQLMAIHHPERVLTLTSLMSTSGRPGLPFGKPEVLKRLTMARPDDREGYIEFMVESDRILAGSGPIDEARARQNAALTYDRGRNPAGSARQIAAFAACNSRHEALQSVRVPSLVVHGALDPLFPIECGRDVAACTPGSRFLEIAQMGHYMPDTTWAPIIDALMELTSSR